MSRLPDFRDNALAASSNSGEYARLELHYLPKEQRLRCGSDATIGPPITLGHHVS